MNVYSEARIIEKVSQRQHGLKTLNLIQDVALNSIGITISDDLLFAERLTMLTWLNQYQLLKEQIKLLLDKLIELAEESPLFSILTSLKGISI